MKTDINVAYNFLTRIGKDHVIVLQPVHNKPGEYNMQGRRISSTEDVQSVFDEGLNVYYTVADLPPGFCRKPGKIDIVSSHFVWVDMDPSLPSEVKKFKDNMFGMLTDSRPSIVPEPTYIVDSGRGINVLWQLSEATKDFATVEAVNRWLMEMFGGDTGTWNLDRALRLPGSWNHLSPKKIKEGFKPLSEPAQIIYESDARHNLSDFGTAKAKSDSCIVGGDLNLPDCEAVFIDDLSRITNYDKIPARVKWLIAQGYPGKDLAQYEDIHGKVDGRDPNDRSAWVYDVSCQLARAEVPEAEVLGLFLDKHWGISANVLDQGNPEKYARRQVARGRVTAEQDPPKQELKVFTVAHFQHVAKLVHKDDPMTAAGFGPIKKGKPADCPEGIRIDAARAVMQYGGGDFTQESIADVCGIQVSQIPDITVEKSTTDNSVLDGDDVPEMVSAVIEHGPTIKFDDETEEFYAFIRGKYRLATRRMSHVVRHTLRNFEVMSGDKSTKRGLRRSHVSEILSTLESSNRDKLTKCPGVLFTNGCHIDGQLQPSSPELFSVGGPDFEYDADATCPTWLGFLTDQWEEDPDSIALLQEWMGLCMVDDTSLQQMMIVIGEPRSGKGTIVRVIKALVGDENYAAFSMTGLCGDFGLQSLIGKTVACAADVRGPFDKSVRSKARELLLGVVGGDPQTVNRKNKSVITYELMARMIMVFNEASDAKTVLLDGKGATAARIRCLELKKSFAGQEDTELFDKLIKEIQGIANWALEGLERLRDKGFTMNGSTKYFREESRNSPAAEWLEDEAPCLPMHTGAAYVSYTTWCEEQGVKPTSAQWFSVQLRDAGVEASKKKICAHKCCKKTFKVYFKGEDTMKTCPNHTISETNINQHEF